MKSNFKTDQVMQISEGNFEIRAEGCTFNVECCTSKHKLYRLNSEKGNYLIAKDYYGVWVELDRKAGSANIPLSRIGQQIDSNQNLRSFSSIIGK